MGITLRVSVDVTTLGPNRTLVSVASDGSNTPNGFLISLGQILITEALDGEFSSAVSTKDAVDAGVYTLGYAKTNADGSCSVAFALKG